MGDGRSADVREGLTSERSSVERDSIAALLASTYELTPAEARIAAYLVGGRNTAEIAEELRVTEETIRTQLKRIYDKTDTRRQAELVRLALRLFVTRLRRSDAG
jgi:DNA-binding CsgD family transcriptional regulator